MKIELPPKYYLDHFRELTSVLYEFYGHLFLESHQNFLRDFDSLSEDAQCLYLRMLNRKGKFFFLEGLSYQEISSLEDAVSELSQMGFAGPLQPDELRDFLPVLPKKKILELHLERNIPHKKSWSKDLLLETISAPDILPTLSIDDVLVQRKTEEIQYLLFLFFGKLQSNLSLYTLRDLGVRKASGRKAQKARFESREEALSHYFYERLYHDDLVCPDIESWPPALSSESLQLRESVLLYMADELKSEEKLTEALGILNYCIAHPGREKKVRLLYQMGLKDECQRMLELLLDSPVSDTEYLFAEDFLNRKFNKQKRSILTETLRNARVLPVDESYFRKPEEGVLDHLKTYGIEGYHLENYLWNSLFGLLFWEELFESDKSAIFNEFERAPKDLYGERFYELHKEAIHLKLNLIISSKEEVLKDISQKIESKSGEPNGIFGWHESILEMISLLFMSAAGTSISEVLLHMAKDYYSRSTGFPDLMLIENGRVKFCEIKAPGDSIKQQQLLQMIALQRAGFEVEVLQVKYTFNPEQLYVVVDLETTGGHLPYHRITEIGAVKVKGGKVIDKFQTLVNPERRISAEITALTGITNEMVRNAPKFHEVAASFQEFTKDAIFVAHNVNFDYGFLQAEYERMEERFVRPYICTKAWMKKYYPGLASYGLKNLTLHFNIDLKTHHRALCDAEAAAGLLFLINEKRAEAASEDS